MRIEIAQLVVIDQLPGIGRPDTDIRLDDHGIPDLRDKLLGSIECGNRMLAGGRDLVLQVNLFHQGFFLDEIDLISLNAGGDMEVRAETGILFQPVLIEGFEPVDLSVLKGEKRDRTEHLVIIFKGIHFIIFRQRGPH